MWNLLLIGWLTVNSSVGRANVMVDEQDGIRMTGKQLCVEVEAGRHVVMVDKNGYQPFIDTLTIHQGQNMELNVWLQPKNVSRQFSIRWGGIGGGLGSGMDVHVSLANMRWGWISLEPCVWGMNMPFFSGVSHVKSTWVMVQQDRRADQSYNNLAVSSPYLQFYYTPMLGAYIPIKNKQSSLVVAAGPQLSWTHISWSEAAIKDGFQFDPVWFSVKAGVLFKGWKSDLMTYFKYQDGYFIGVDLLF